jgi:alpha-glucoside transport system substrate-binding protein
MRPLRRLSLFLAAVLATGACSMVNGDETLTVLASWTGVEETAFKQVLKGFEDETGIKVNYTGTRALNQVLQADVQKGQPPDVAVLPSPGELANYVRGGYVHDVDGILGDRPEESYSRQWLTLLKVETSKIQAVPVKADLKSIVWYNPVTFGNARPTTWDELTAVAGGLRARGVAPWCVGMGATPASGWPGTDWIEDILLLQSGPAAYQRWSAGTLAWNSPEVERAWTTWGELVTTPGSMRGGTTAALLTDFGDAGRGMFTGPPGCMMEHQGSFMLGGYRNQGVAGGNFDYFPFPTSAANPNGASEVSADLAAMFRPSDHARRFMAYLADERGQKVWPSLGSAFSANKKVDVYADGVGKRIAARLTAEAPLCFDASDLMPATMSDAFTRAALEYLGNPASLDSLLDSLEKVRAEISPDDRLNVACGG